MRDRYGRNTFGQSCLVARRLVERGVAFVTINYNGWDTHKQNFQDDCGNDCRKWTRPGGLDRGPVATRSARQHHPLVGRRVRQHAEGPVGSALERRPQSSRRCVLHGPAGGGFKGGHVVGSTDAKGEQVHDRPVSPGEVIASMYELLGIGPGAKLPHPQGLDVPAVPPALEGTAPVGRLSEIM